MKSILNSSLLAFIILFVGCQNKLTSNIEEQLPSSVTGTWKSDSTPWEITIKPNGIVESVTIPLGQVKLKPNKITKVPMKDGSTSIYKAGDIEASYNPETSELFILVEVKDFNIAYKDNRITGHQTDRFVGPVSADGKYWTPTWVNVYDYGPRFPYDPNDSIGKPLTFIKTENSKKNSH